MTTGPIARDQRLDPQPLSGRESRRLLVTVESCVWRDSPDLSGHTLKRRAIALTKIFITGPLVQWIECHASNLAVRVRFPSPAPIFHNRGHWSKHSKLAILFCGSYGSSVVGSELIRTLLSQQAAGYALIVGFQSVPRF
jgi:hypothetical protein